MTEVLNMFKVGNYTGKDGKYSMKCDFMNINDGDKFKRSIENEDTAWLFPTNVKKLKSMICR